MTDKFPAVPPELLEALERQFPNQLPPANTDLRTIDTLIGQQSVIACLRRYHDEQQRDGMDTVLSI